MAAAERPEPLLRFAGRRPEDGSRVAAPSPLAVALRDYARSRGLTIGRLERSRAKASGSLYLMMVGPDGRRWILRISNHRRPRRTGHAIPHIDLVSLDGTSGFDVGCTLIDRMIAGALPWFDAEQTIRHLPHSKRRKGMRRCKR